MYNPSLGYVRFPGERVTIGSWRSLHLHQGMGEHDFAEATFAYPASAQNSFTTGSPIEFSFGMSGAPYRTWTGYIHAPEQSVFGQVSEMTLSCLGPTYGLSGSGQTSWTNITASAVVEQLCAAQGLAAHTSGTSRVYQHLTQAGMTGWELINRLARENGRFVIPDGVGLRFASRQDIHSTFNVQTCINLAASQDNSSQVLSWKPLQSEDPGAGERTAIKSFSGVDPQGRLVRHVQSTQPQAAPFGTSTGRRLFLDAKTATAVTSAAEAEALHSAATELSAWKYRMTATVRGRQGLEPGVVVRTLGMDRYSGTWVVQAVSHVVENGEYVCHLDLITDALGQLPRQYQNVGGITRPLPKATPVLRQTSSADPSSAFATSQTRWQAQNRVTLQAFLPRPTPSGSTVRRATRRG